MNIDEKSNKRKYCPLKTITVDYTKIGQMCMKEECALWEDIIGRCALAVHGYLLARQKLEDELI